MILIKLFFNIYIYSESVSHIIFRLRHFRIDSNTITEMPPRRVKTQYWDFVFNNETDETTETLKKLLTQWNIIIDSAFQHEVAPTTGTKHLQGWLKLDKRQYKSYLLRSRLNEGEWENKLSFRPARNPKALMAYVKKEQEGAHGYWCKSIEEKKNELTEQVEEGYKLIREAIKWEEEYKKRLGIEHLSLNEYLDYNSGYDTE